MVGSLCIYRDCYDGHLPGAATSSCKSEKVAPRSRLPAACRCWTGWCCFGVAEAKRATSVLCVLRLPTRNADKRSVRGVPPGSAGTESGLLADRFEYQGQRLWVENRVDLVGHWDDSRGWILHLRLPLVRRESRHRQGLPRLRQLNQKGSNANF